MPLQSLMVTVNALLLSVVYPYSPNWFAWLLRYPSRRGRGPLPSAGPSSEVTWTTPVRGPHCPGAIALAVADTADGRARARIVRSTNVVSRCEFFIPGTCGHTCATEEGLIQWQTTREPLSVRHRHFDGVKGYVQRVDRCTSRRRLISYFEQGHGVGTRRRRVG